MFTSIGVFQFSLYLMTKKSKVFEIKWPTPSPFQQLLKRKFPSP